MKVKPQTLFTLGASVLLIIISSVSVPSATTSAQSSSGDSQNEKQARGLTSGPNLIVRARGTAGDEHINLRIDGEIVDDWTLTTEYEDYIYTGDAAGHIMVHFDNDSAARNVILDYVYVNGEVRQAEHMQYNGATFANGQCGGGGFSETMHCNGAIGFGPTDACFSGECLKGGLSSADSKGHEGEFAAYNSDANTCHWYGTDYPLCTETDTGWGWENNQSCITRERCLSQ